MKIATENNIYAREQAATWARYEAHLSGGQDALMLVASARALSEAAASALLASAERLGWKRDSVAFATVEAEAGEGADAARDAAPLSARDLEHLIEGLDPVSVVLADATACTLCAEAYGAPEEPDSAFRLRGRNAVAFLCFEDMLETSRDKQRAWALLKQLPY